MWGAPNGFCFASRTGDHLGARLDVAATVSSRSQNHVKRRTSGISPGERPNATTFALVGLEDLNF